MSLMTRCPACQTLFRLVPDQLRIFEGWVRCGQCAEAFDASVHLVQSPPVVAPVVIAKNTDTLPVVAQRSAEPLVLSLPEEQPAATPGPPEEMLNTPAEEAQAVENPQAKDTIQAQETVQGEPAVMPAPVETNTLLRETTEDTQRERAPDSDEVSFLRQTRTPATQPGRFMGAVWVFLSGVLFLGLGAQIALQERDRIAAFQPHFKPWLQALCEPLNCKVSPWRHMDSIVIDSSAFTRLRGESYRLSFTLKNTAAVPVALPALELTLTDSLDQPVVRRVLMSSELAMTSDTVDAGGEQPVSLALAVNPAGGNDRIAGYRLLAFYP